MTAALLYSYVIKTLVRLRVSISYLNFPIEIFYQNKSAAVNHGVISQSTEQWAESIEYFKSKMYVIDLEAILNSKFNIELVLMSKVVETSGISCRIEV